MKREIMTIVRQVVEEYLFSRSPQKKTLLILLAYDATNPKMIWEKIRSLSANYHLILCITKQWEDIPHGIYCDNIIQLKNENIGNIKDALQRADVLLLPTVSYTFISKLALSIDDDLTLWTALRMQLDSKRIIVVDDEIDHKSIRHLTAPPSVCKRIQKYLHQLRTDGVEITSLSNIDQYLKLINQVKESRTFIVMEKHIQKLAKEGKRQLKLPKKSVVTPMARDMAHQFGITISQEGKVREGDH